MNTAVDLARLDGRRVVVEVPASSANLGAGYDCLGLALAMTNEVEVEVRAHGVGAIELSVEGEGAHELKPDRRNRFVAGLEAVLREARIDPHTAGWRIAMRNGIPFSRGLGSSAAASVGGALAANALLGEPLTQPDLLRLATGIEGHPDNAGAVLLGGFVVSAALDGRVEAIRFDVPREVVAILFIPEKRFSTSAMRRVLPQSVALADAVANLGRVAIGVAGMASGRSELLRAMTVDRLHEPYRAVAYPQLPALISAAREAGALGACLSGAGSTVLAFCDDPAASEPIQAAFRAVASETRFPGRVEVVAPRNDGARVVALT